ncbi:SH3 domain-containing protein [Yoonia sp. MH D7]
MTRALFALLALLTFGGGAASAQEIGSYSHVQAGALNLRTAPDTGSSVLRALPYGTSVSILDRRGDWAKVFVQGAEGNAAEGWVAARFLGQDVRTGSERSRPIFRGDEAIRPRQPHRPTAPLRVSNLDFDCRPPLFGNSGIRNCVASVRVQLSQQEFDPDRNDHVFIVCRGTVSYRTDQGRGSQRLIAFERNSIAHNDRLGQSVHVNFPVRSERDKIVSARLVSFSCERD